MTGMVEGEVCCPVCCKAVLLQLQCEEKRESCGVNVQLQWVRGKKHLVVSRISRCRSPLLRYTARLGSPDSQQNALVHSLAGERMLGRNLGRVLFWLPSHAYAPVVARMATTK